MRGNVHYGDSWYFSNSAFQVFIASSNNKTSILFSFKMFDFSSKFNFLTCFTLLTMQSSAYVPLWSHFIFSNLGSFDNFKANLYLCPNFSISAVTHSEMIGMHFPKRQSIEALKISNLF